MVLKTSHRIGIDLCSNSTTLFVTTLLYIMRQIMYVHPTARAFLITNGTLENIVATHPVKEGEVELEVVVELEGEGA